jgi:hypothetical protein
MARAPDGYADDLDGTEFKTAVGWRFSWFDGESMEPDDLLPYWGQEVAPKLFTRPC